MIGYILATGKSGGDLLLHGVAEKLIERGVRPCGVVQTNTPADCRENCDMDVMVLPEGPVFRISQNLGLGSKGCRLDPAALEASVGLVATQLHNDVDVLMINKFGKQEAAGHGFRDVIAQAMVQGIPVLVGLNAMNRAAFEAFVGPYADELAADEAVLLDWIERQLPRESVVA